MTDRPWVHELLEHEPEVLPGRHGQSRAQFYRVFQRMLQEPPVAIRRRLLLERAAWQLGRTRDAVTEIAFDAGYDSLEAFTRAFRRAYGTSPSLYRRMGAWRIHLPAPNSIHYAGPGEGKRGNNDMDLYELFAGTDAWYTRKLLDHAAQLTDEQLDRAIPSTAYVYGWDKPDQNLREILERMVITKEVWAAALLNGPMPQMENFSAEQRSPKGLRERFDRVEEQFQKALCEVRNRGAWDETFVDALCEPAETFTFGGMFAHVITYNTQRRLSALDALHRLGVPMEGIGDPMEYEAAQKRVL